MLFCIDKRWDSERRYRKSDGTFEAGSGQKSGSYRRCGRKQCVRYRGGLDRDEKCLRYKRIKSWKTVVLSCNKTRSTLKGRYIEVCMLLFFVWELEYGTETLPHRNINYSICTKNNFKII